MWFGRLLLCAVLLVFGCKANSGDKSGSDASAGVVLELSPPVGGQGTELDVQLTATESFFTFEGTTVDFGDGITVESVDVADGWGATARILIDADAELGKRDVKVRADGPELTVKDGFEVIAQSFAIDPDSAYMGETVTVEFVGHETDWTGGKTWPSFGEGVDVLEFSVLSSTLAEATVAVSPTASPGWRDVVMDSGGGDLVTLYRGFKVDRFALTATFDPAEVEQGDTVDFTIKANGTNFSTSSPPDLLFYDAYGQNTDVVMDSITVLDAENLYGRMTVSNAAELGYRDVLVRSDAGSVMIDHAFTVSGGDFSLEDVAIALAFYVVRQIDNSTGFIDERVVAYCEFYVPLDPQCPPDPETACTDGADNDGDGYTDCDDADCSSSGVCPSPSPYDVSVVVGGTKNGDVDCPNPSTVSAGDHVWLESDSNTVTLDKFVDSATGTIYYYGKDLTIDDYVPNEVYSLHTEGEDGAIPEEVLDDVLYTVPADWSIISPDLWGNYTIDRNDDWTFQWTPAGTYPNAFFVASVSGTLVDPSGWPGAVVVIPWDDGEFTFSSSDLLQLEAGPATFSAYSVWANEPYFGLQESIYQSNQASSYIYLDASVVLQ